MSPKIETKLTIIYPKLMNKSVGKEALGDCFRKL